MLSFKEAEEKYRVEAYSSNPPPVMPEKVYLNDVDLDRRRCIIEHTAVGENPVIMRGAWARVSEVAYPDSYGGWARKLFKRYVRRYSVTLLSKTAKMDFYMHWLSLLARPDRDRKRENARRARGYILDLDEYIIEGNIQFIFPDEMKKIRARYKAKVLKRETALYKHVGKDGELLYVGITFDPRSRYAQHKRKANWFKQIRNIEITWYPDRESAQRQETTLIKSKKPPYNKALNPDYYAGLNHEISI